MSVIGQAIAAVLPLVPRQVTQRFARPYVAGEHVVDAVATVESLMGEGCAASIDVLGEESSSAEDARELTQLYLAMLDEIADRSLDANVSVKLSGLGLRLDAALAESNLAAIVDHAATLGNFVRIDMEDSSLTDATLELYRRLRSKRDNLGVVLQACLKRTPNDVISLIAPGVDVRVVKGIYVEPETIGHRGRQLIRDRFMDTTETLLSAGSRAAIATHDDQLVDRSIELIRSLNVPRHGYEFQMLLGVRPGLRRQLVNDGHPVRVYVPFGRDWHAYSLRRLKENPAIAGHVLRSFFDISKR